MSSISLFFFFNDTATTEIYTLSLHDALPILRPPEIQVRLGAGEGPPQLLDRRAQDRKSTRLNSSHLVISYAVFSLQKNTEYSNPHVPLMTRWSRSSDKSTPTSL